MVNKVSLWLFVKIQGHKNYGISNFIQMTLRPYHEYELHRKYGQADQTAHTLQNAMDESSRRTVHI